MLQTSLSTCLREVSLRPYSHRWRSPNQVSVCDTPPSPQPRFPCLLATKLAPVLTISEHRGKVMTRLQGQASN